MFKLASTVEKFCKEMVNNEKFYTKSFLYQDRNSIPKETILTKTLFSTYFGFMGVRYHTFSRIKVELLSGDGFDFNLLSKQKNYNRKSISFIELGYDLNKNYFEELCIKIDNEEKFVLCKNDEKNFILNLSFPNSVVKITESVSYGGD